MEIKANLKKPYTEEQRLDFIVENNHQNGYEIKETKKALEAWGYTEDEKAAEREANFNKAFFNTSLGYIRRKVTLADGTHKDFLSDFVPTIQMAISLGQTVNILTYTKPPFDEDITDWTPYQEIKAATPEFILECANQLGNDFLPINKGEGVN